MSNTNIAVCHESCSFEKMDGNHLKLVKNNKTIEVNENQSKRREFKTTHNFLDNYGIEAKREGFFDGL